MRTTGTGMIRQAIGVEWPSPVEVVPVVEPVIIHAEPLPPLHLCEVPDSMLSSRARLASAWAGLQPGQVLVKVKPPTKSTVKPKRATTKAKKSAGKPKKAPAKRSRKAA